MSSDSESDEQFESADEDFETEKHVIANISNDEILPKLTDLKLSSKPSVVLENRTESSDSKTQTFTKPRENDNSSEKNPKIETSPSQSNKESNVQTSASKEPSFLKEKDKVKEVVNNKNSGAHNESPEGYKAQSENLIPNINEKSKKSNPPYNPVEDNTSVTKVEETSIGADCDGWDVDSDDEISKALPKTLCFGNINKSDSNTTKIKENFCGNKGDSSGSLISGHITSDKTQIKDLKSHKTNIKNENLKENTNKDSGVDGWDVEVEDGFEIPVDLNKSSSHATGGSERFPFSLTNPLQKLVDVREDSWGGWGSWGGVGNILSTASSGVTNLTSQVSHGFSHVLGAPDPAELAKLDKELSEQRTHLQHNAQQPAQEVSHDTRDTPSTAGESPVQTSNTVAGQAPFSFNTSDSTGLFSLSQLTRLVETTGSKVIAGGLDTLENLGKKTMEVLQEGDPGLKRKRALLFPNQDKPVLSQVLRDAKGRLESEDKHSKVEEKSTFPNPVSTKNLHFETLLDDYQGLAHLEALEILSKQCSLKLHNALMAKSGDEKQTQELNDFQETLQQIREMCQVEDASDPADCADEEEEEVMGFGEKIEDIVRLYDLSSKLNCERLVQVNKKMTLQIDRAPLQVSCETLYAQCLRSMAEFTSVAMELFHKCASLLLLKSKHRTVDETDALTQLTSLVCSRITALASGHCRAMVQLDKDSPLITSVYLEAANSCSYLQEASQLLVPVLQIVAIEGAS